MSADRIQNKPIIGISLGEINGVGPEVVIKTLAQKHIYKMCAPVIFGHSKVLNHYRKSLDIEGFDYTLLKNTESINPNNKTSYVIQPDGNEPHINTGVADDESGNYALEYLNNALTALQKKQIDALVTAPLNKNNIKPKNQDFKGHTDYIKSFFGEKEVLMMMVTESLKIGLHTGHVPLADVPKFIDRNGIFKKIELFNQSLKRDFLIHKPKIAVLSFNPHAGENGLLGKEEIDQIIPAVNLSKEKGILCFGPYGADGFFGAGHFKKFDGIFAMYHDQALIPFKTMAFEEGVNFTAGLPVIRTSPDHGTALDIAGENKADYHSFENAIYKAVETFHNRIEFDEMHANPLNMSIKEKE